MQNSWYNGMCNPKEVAGQFRRMEKVFRGVYIGAKGCRREAVRAYCPFAVLQTFEGVGVMGSELTALSRFIFQGSLLSVLDFEQVPYLPQVAKQHGVFLLL
jgi:hypothetical protein